jgi:hypothetical protein
MMTVPVNKREVPVCERRMLVDDSNSKSRKIGWVSFLSLVQRESQSSQFYIERDKVRDHVAHNTRSISVHHKFAACRVSHLIFVWGES